MLTIGGVSFPLPTLVTTPVEVAAGESRYDVTYDAFTGLFSIVNADAGEVLNESDLDTLIRGITYSNSLLEPTPGDRTVAFTLTDESGQVSLPAVATISVTVTDTDGDGSSDAVEGGQDRNSDGIDDAIQSDVATVINPVTGAFVTIEVTSAEGCNVLTNSDHLFESELAEQDPDADYFLGLTDFFVQCLSLIHI